MDLLCRAPWPQEIRTVMTMFTNTRSQKDITFQAGVKTLPAKLKPPDPETPKTEQHKSKFFNLGVVVINGPQSQNATI